VIFQIVPGSILLAAAFAWVLSDRQVRNLRAVVLLVVASVTGVSVGYLLNTSWGFVIGAFAGGLLALPVLMRHPLVTTMKPADTAILRSSPYTT
jgi:hypothetical protein